MAKKLPLRFYQRDTILVAKELLGKRLVRMYRGQRISGIITETEAYLGIKDSACHTYGGRRTRRVEPMYLAGGHTYTYFVYGMHYCFNVVTRKKEEPEAVLIRGLTSEIPRLDGPAKICKALKIGKSFNGISLAGNTIFVEDLGITPKKIFEGPRVGVAYATEGGAKDWPLRFWIQ